jgi:immune inhibitor A
MIEYNSDMAARFALSVLVLTTLAAGADKPDFATRQASIQRESAMRSPERTARKSGTEKVLMLLVEFGGPDTVEFIPDGPNRSTWDPIGKADTSEYTGIPGDCSAIVRKYGITGPTRYTYSGPLHNRIERPRSASDASGGSIWSEDFSADYYSAIASGNGYRYRYKRQDGTDVDQDATGSSVAAYYRDASLGALGVEVEVVGWIQVPHSLYWYGADPCPGRLSGSPSMEDAGAIPGAGGVGSFVADAIEAARRARPELDWAAFDKDKDGLLDHLWIVHAGLGQEQGATLLNRTEYGEGTLWSSSGMLGKPVDVAPGLKVGQVILLPENAGATVLAHEFAHRLGADDLYNIASTGEPSTGVWTLMSDSWLGVPGGTAPQAFDPWHLDLWGWLDPLVISDPAQEYVVKVGQTSRFPGGEGVYRGVRIDLPAGTSALPAKPSQSWYWWGGQRDATDSMMTLARPVKVPTGSPALRFSLAYSIEQGWDFLFVQISDDGGKTWKILTNSSTTCKSAAGWMGGASGLPEDLCAAGAGGFTGKSAGYPALVPQSFDLSAYADKEILVRFRYFTDTAWTEDGPFLDDVAIAAGQQTVFSDGAESGEPTWVLTGDFHRSDGALTYPQSYYLQWRNTGADGGFDSILARPDWAPGPMATGLLVWYSNGRYTSNNIRRSLLDAPGFGPKGRLLVVNARPEPYRSPDMAASGYNNESANLTSRYQLRGAPFSLQPSPPFTVTLSGRTVSFEGQAAAPRFRDGSNYLPGLEFTATGPRRTGGDQWMTRRWNTGVVLPSRTAYGVKGAGYLAGTPILFNCSANTSQGTSNCESAAAPMDGGSGNPADTGGHYGWNVDILEQTASGAKLRIWNELGR